MKNSAKVDILLTNFSYTCLKTFRGMYVGLAPHHAQSEIPKHTINLGFFHNIKKNSRRKCSVRPWGYIKSYRNTLAVPEGRCHQTLTRNKSNLFMTQKRAHRRRLTSDRHLPAGETPDLVVALCIKNTVGWGRGPARSKTKYLYTLKKIKVGFSKLFQ